MGDESALQAEIKSLSANVERLTMATEKLSDKVNKIGILEERDKQHSESIGRAFTETRVIRETIGACQKDAKILVDKLVSENEKEMVVCMMFSSRIRLALCRKMKMIGKLTLYFHGFG
jgi:hypothetical protein